MSWLWSMTIGEPGLVHLQPAEVIAVGEEARVGGDPAVVGVGVQLGHPRPHPVGIEDRVPGPIERVSHIHPLAVAAELHHLRATTQPQIRRGGYVIPCLKAALWALDRSSYFREGAACGESW